MTIFSFAAIFAGLGLGVATQNYMDATILVVGVFIGSILWWVLLSTAVSKLSERFGDKVLHLVNKLAGIIIGIFGLVALVNLVF